MKPVEKRNAALRWVNFVKMLLNIIYIIYIYNFFYINYGCAGSEKSRELEHLKLLCEEIIYYKDILIVYINLI